MYIVVAILGLFLFGSTIRDNLLLNVATETAGWDTYLLRSLFAVIMACHIPFIFFYGKESILLMIDEIHRSSISN